MNTKTNHEYASNPYNGGVMGSDSPAALLDMLAEVASQTLHSEKKRTKSLLALQCKPKTDFLKKKTQEATINVPQLLSMPASQLVKQFSIFTSDELKRQYSYTCALVIGCGQKYTSFASEGRARMSIKAHLAEHLEFFKTNKEAYNSFTAKSLNYKAHKANPQSKKGKSQQSKKPQETLNKENKNVILEKSTNYLRNILLNDASFKELDKHKNQERMENLKKLHNSEPKEASRMDFKVLGDHSYFERLEDEIPNTKETSSIINSVDSTAPDENIVLMVVGTDSIHMKEYSQVNKKLSQNVNQDFNNVYLPEISWQDECCNRNVEITTTTKPKGKAKFIGTSKEEREMALAFMDRIKKKGNPTGSNLECRICNPPRSFTAPTTLVSHYRSHAGIKPYECRICRAVFTRRHSLKYHMLIHQNQTRFTCADCGKKFRHPSHFREHRRRHTGEAPFGCDDCGQRFKTRNTYKRHLKTRHGKVLTTTGELLYLSEEDFQKVRTNRKKKTYFDKEHTIDEGIIAAKAIMNYQKDNDHHENTIDVTEEFIIDEDADKNGRNWKANGTIQIIKKCFQTYDVCAEPRSDKTEPVETEVALDSTISDNNGNNIQEEYINKVQENLPELQSASYNRLEIMKDEQGQLVCRDGIEDQSEFIYSAADEAPAYIEVKYSSTEDDAKEDSNAVAYEENIEFLESPFKNHIQVIQPSNEDYSDNIARNETNSEQETEYLHNAKQEQPIEIIHADIERVDEEEYDRQIVISQDIVQYEKLDGSLFSNKLYKEAEDLSQTKNPLQCESEDHVWREDESIDNYQTIVPRSMTEKNQKHLSQHKKLKLYVRDESLAEIIAQNKRVNVLPQFNASNEPQNQAKTRQSRSRKFALLNRQSVNVKQNGKQSAILLLTNTTLKSSVFNMDKNYTADNNGVETETSGRSK